MQITKKNEQIFAICAITLAAVILLWQAKILFIAALFSAGAWYISRNDKSKSLTIAMLPIALGLLLAWFAASMTQSGMTMVSSLQGSSAKNSLLYTSTLKKAPKQVTKPVKAAAPPPISWISWRSWIGVTSAKDTPDKAGQLFLIIGAGVGFLIAWKLKPKPWHGPGVVAGRPVIEGGWATAADLSSACDFGPPRPGAGYLPLGRLEGRIVRLNPNKGKMKIAGHMLIVGATGTGKSYTCIRNLIIAAIADGHSVVISDLKGELFEDFAPYLMKNEYDLIGFNCINPKRSFRWNALAECRDFDEIKDMAAWLISAAGDDHAFFSGGEKNILAAALAYARWVLPEKQRHFRSALSILTWPQETLNELYTQAFKAGKVSQDAYETWKAEQGHYSNYIEGVRNKLGDITKAGLSALTAASDFSLSDLGKKKTALFLLLPERGELQSLYVPFYTFMFKRLQEAADSQPGGKLKVQVRFILDEMANIGKIPDIDKVCSLGRSRGIMVQMAFQTIGQLQGLYRKNNVWEAVAGSCPVKTCLSTDDLNSARFFTSMMGGARVKDIKESRDVSTPLDGLETKRRESVVDRDLMKPSGLLELPEDDCIVKVRGKKMAYMQKIAWVELPQAKDVLAAGKLKPNEYLPETEPVEVPPYPEGEEKPKEPDRARGGGMKVKDKKPSASVPVDNVEIVDKDEIDQILG